MKTATALLALALLVGPAGAASATGDQTVGGERLTTSGVVVDAPGADPLPKVSGDAWLVADLGTGEVLAAKDPHGRYRPASIIKVLMALAVLPQVSPDDVYTAQWEDANAEGSRAAHSSEANTLGRRITRPWISSSHARYACQSAKTMVLSCCSGCHRSCSGVRSRTSTSGYQCQNSTFFVSAFVLMPPPC